MTNRPIRMALALCAFAVGLFAETDPRLWPVSGLAERAEARVGRPLTPASVAGVSRRTTRRVVRRTAVTVAALPTGCAPVVVNGATLQNCGGVYYQPSGSQYVVVEVQ